MKLERFLGKFEELADTPNSVPRIRRFILDLAVRGKLVEQDTEVEPAHELLERVQAEKAHLTKTGEIKKQEQLPPVADDAVPFTLPPGWAASQLGDVAVCLDYMREPINGTERDLRIAGKAESELFPYYGATQQQGWIDDFIFDTELVLLGEDGIPFFDDLRPKAYLISGKTWVNNHAHVFRGILVSNPFIMHWLNTFDYAGRVAGSTRSKLNQAKALIIPIALPPLAEQKRIVAKVDELMALCDRLEAQQQERETRHDALARASLARFADAPTPANLNFIFHKSYAISPADLRKSILTLAVQGKLVPQDPNDEPAQATFPGLKSVIPESNDGSEPPNDWAFCTYRSLATLVTSGSRGWKEFYAKTGSIFVRTQNIKTDKLLLDDVAFVDLPKSAEGMRAQVLKDDILITITGANVTKAARVKEQIPEAYVSQHIALTRPRWAEMSDWLHLCFISPGSARGTLETLAYGDKPGLNLNNIRDLVIPIPPVNEQRRIVAKVDQLMVLVDELETLLTTSRKTGSDLIEAVVYELTARA
jgi:type I restriction enzyme S subunit